MSYANCNTHCGRRNNAEGRRPLVVGTDPADYLESRAFGCIVHLPRHTPLPDSAQHCRDRSVCLESKALLAWCLYQLLTRFGVDCEIAFGNPSSSNQAPLATLLHTKIPPISLGASNLELAPPLRSRVGDAGGGRFAGDLSLVCPQVGK